MFAVDRLWHEGCIESVNKKNTLYYVKYNNGDAEDMTIAEIRKHWVKPDKEEKKSSSKKR